MTASATLKKRRELMTECADGLFPRMILLCSDKARAHSPKPLGLPKGVTRLLVQAALRLLLSAVSAARPSKACGPTSQGSIQERTDIAGIHVTWRVALWTESIRAPDLLEAVGSVASWSTRRPFFLHTIAVGVPCSIVRRGAKSGTGGPRGGHG